MSLIGLSNKIEDPIHPAKSTKPEPFVIRPDYLVVGGGFLPSETDFGGSNGGSSLPQPDPPDPTVIYNLQCLGFLVLSYFLNLKALSHSLNISNMCRSTLISQYRQALNLHHRRSVPSSQPPSLPICDSLPFTIVDLQSLPFTISDLRVKVVVFSYFLFISLFQSHASPVSICVLWIYRLLVFGFIDLFFSVDLFSKICEIFGL